MSDITPQNNPPPKKILPIIIQEAIRRFRCEPVGGTYIAEIMEALTFLLQNGADPNVPDDYGETPIQIATENGNIQIVELLIQHGANPNVSDDYGKTPIQIATENGNIQIVELLLKHGANKNVSDNSGKTPIQIATENNRQDLIDLLNDYTSQTTSTALNSPPHTNNQALPLEREGGPVANTTGDRMKREHRSRKKTAKQLRNRVSPHKKYTDDGGNPISASEKRNLEAKIRKDEIEGRCADILFGRMLRVRIYGKPPEDESITPNEIFPHEFRIFCFPRRKRTKLPLPKKPRGLTPPLPKKPPPLKKRIPKIYYSNGYFRVRKKQGRYTIKIMPPTGKKQINIGIKLMKMHAREMLSEGRFDDLYRSGLCAFLTPEEIQREKNRIVKELMDEYRAESRRKNRLAEKRYRQQQKEEQKRQRQQQKEEQKRQRQQQKEEQKRQQQKPPPQLPPPNNPDAP